MPVYDTALFWNFVNSVASPLDALQVEPAEDCIQPAASRANRQLLPPSGGGSANAVCLTSMATGTPQPSCVNTFCVNGELYVDDIAGSKLCTEGESLTIETPDSTVGQMLVGPCPPSTEVCPFKGCPSTAAGLCSGRGWCHKGVCHCNLDAEGAACQRLLCIHSHDCLQGFECFNSSCVVANGTIAAQWPLFPTLEARPCS